MGQTKSNENEVALFFAVDDASLERLKNWSGEYLQITQSETNAMTQNNSRITVRVRRTETHPNGETVYEAATKYRLPYDPKSLTSKCIELEKVITEEEYALALPFGERLYQKRRFIFPLTDTVDAELDWYFDKTTKDFGRFCKLDINTPPEGFSPEQITALLKLLPNKGIVITDLINPPWKQSGKIKTRISALMETQWNLL